MDMAAYCSRCEQYDWQPGAAVGTLRPEADLTEGRTRSGCRYPDVPPARSAPAGKEREAAARMDKTISHMLGNLDAPLRMSALSKLAGTSASNFYHLFKLATGYTPNDFFIRARMGRACELLRETNLSVKQVAAVLGYNDQFYFSRLFKSVNGVPPREYRLRAAGLPRAEASIPLPRFEQKASGVPSAFSDLAAAKTAEPLRNIPKRNS